MKILPNWLKTMSFWNKLRSILTLVGVGSEIGLYAADADPFYKKLVLAATLIGILITHFIEDKNGNDVPDIFEDTPTTPK